VNVKSALRKWRAFNHHDTASSPKVAVVNRALAQKFFPNENPIGKIFEADPEDVDGPIQIVALRRTLVTRICAKQRRRHRRRR